MTEPALTIHVERTANADILRWVCHRPDLDATSVPPPDSALGRMISDADIVGVAAQSGDLLIRFPHRDDRDDPDKLAAVHRAVIDALRRNQWTAHTGLTNVTIRARSTRPARPSSRAGPTTGTGHMLVDTMGPDVAAIR